MNQKTKKDNFLAYRTGCQNNLTTASACHSVVANENISLHLPSWTIITVLSELSMFKACITHLFRNPRACKSWKMTCT